MSTEDSPLSAPAPTVLGELATELEERPWALASENDESVRAKSLKAAKALFDLSVKCEQLSHPHIQPFLVSILEPPSIETRSKSQSNSAQADKTPMDPNETFPYTPLDLLTVEGFDPDQIWAQLELKNEGLVPVLSKMGEQEQVPEGIEELSDASSDDMTLEEFREMLKEAGYEGIDEMSDDEVEELKEEMEGDDGEDGKMSLDEFREMYREAGEDVDSMTEEELRERMEEMEGGSDSDSDSEESGSEDDEEESDSEEGEEGEDEDEEMLSGEDDELSASASGSASEEEDNEEAGLSASDDEDDSSALLSGSAPSSSTPGPSKARKSKSKHPTLDDDFFSIDDFNRQTEELEAGRLTSGGLGGDDEEEEEELQDFGSLMLGGAGDDDEFTYADFFEPPKGGAKKPSSSGSKEKKGKGKRSKKPKYDEDEDMDEEEEEEEEVDDDEEAFGIMGRVKGDLFDSDDEGEAEEQVLSAHEKRQKALALQIAELEDQAVGPKEWTLLGEASSKARPENSLLEEDLDFEQVGKVVPVVTEDSVKSMEELIKQRILDNNFDSPVRVRAYEPTPFLPSRFFDLQDTQSAKSLAQIYEEDYQAAASGEKVKDARDEKLNKAHEEIDGLWNDICYKLDALSSLNFVPKAPKANISTISDLPTTSMESALPPTSAASTMLAPQELFAAPTSSSLVARSELTSEDAQALRTKHRRHKKADRKKLGEMEELYGKKKQSVKEQKEEALKGLVKSGKGVTIVGKGGKEQGKAVKRGGEGQGEQQDGKRLKL
ncbi:hypothetical protein B9479_005163 [Cryptococcus floricola]|uniref:U3 small nucleolar ribonucleoprotein protein MPP10 n=1 Tax=Cryptococcus floricola TaxID=2591691 RepID=A0A5D3ATK8_9TREE|nr:hypothetical protein B9479_005163 [Cryptococcus floricola]